jgi:hypothetical protein
MRLPSTRRPALRLAPASAGSAVLGWHALGRRLRVEEQAQDPPAVAIESELNAVDTAHSDFAGRVAGDLARAEHMRHACPHLGAMECAALEEAASLPAGDRLIERCVRIEGRRSRSPARIGAEDPVPCIGMEKAVDPCAVAGLAGGSGDGREEGIDRRRGIEPDGVGGRQRDHRRGEGNAHGEHGAIVRARPSKTPRLVQRTRHPVQPAGSPASARSRGSSTDGARPMSAPPTSAATRGFIPRA